MEIIVIGAGVVGVTTAYSLAREGHDVTVVERLAKPGMETSRANAAQRSYGYVYPWADPGMVKKAALWMLKSKAPFKLKLPPSARTVGFLSQTWRYAKAPGLFEANERALLRLGAYSRECFQDLERAVPLAFDGGHGGLIDIASDPEAAHALRGSMGLLDEMGVEHEWLTAQHVYTHEPALARSSPLHGGLRITGDGTGDCHLFTQALAAHCRAMGVKFLFDTEVIGAASRQGRIGSVTLRPTQEPSVASREVSADAFVICAGCQSEALGKLIDQRMPIYPVKGYSITAPIRDERLAPRSTVIDDRHKVVITRLGRRVRVAGFAELSSFDRRIPKSRIDTLCAAMEFRFPGAVALERAEPWAGFRPVTPDGPPVIGQGAYANLFLNTGHGIFGWTFSAASAEIIAGLVSGRGAEIDTTAYRPERFQRGAARRMAVG